MEKRLRSGLCAVALCVCPAGAAVPPQDASPSVTPGPTAIVREVTLDDFESEIAWRPPWFAPAEAEFSVVRSTAKSHAGRHSQKVTYKIMAGAVGRYTLLYTGIPIPGKPSAIKVWCFGNGSRVQVSARIGIGIKPSIHVPLGKIDFLGWGQLEGKVAIPREWHRPPQFNGLKFDGLKNGDGGTIFFDDISVVTELAPAEQVRFEASTTGEHNIFALGVSPEVRLRARSYAPAGVSVGVEGRAIDFWGKQVWQTDETLGLEPGQAKDLRFELPISRPGYYEVLFRVRRSGTEERAVTVPLACLGGAPDTRMRPGSFFGMNVHTRYANEELPLLHATGARSIRNHFEWREIELEKGKYTFMPQGEAWIAGMQALGMQFFPVLCYGNPLYDGDKDARSPEAVRAFGKFCYEQVKRWAGKDEKHIDYWEVWNEPNLPSFYKGTAEDYFSILRVAFANIRRADPAAKVVGCSTAGTDLKFIEKVMALGGARYLDAISIHPYRYPRRPEDPLWTLKGDVLKTKALIEKYGGGKEIWVTELGWPTHVGERAVDLRTQANYLARAYLEVLSTRAVHTLHWYDLKNDALDASSNEANFGVVLFDLKPKPAMVALRTLTTMLEDGRFLQGTESGPVRAYQFAREGDDGAIWAIWSHEPCGPVSLRPLAGQVVLTDLMGNAQTVTPRDDALTIVPLESPVFLMVPTRHNLEVQMRTKGEK